MYCIDPDIRGSIFNPKLGKMGQRVASSQIGEYIIRPYHVIAVNNVTKLYDAIENYQWLFARMRKYVTKNRFVSLYKI